MGRLPRAAEARRVHHVLSRGNARTRICAEDSDHAAFANVLVEAHERVALRTCIARGRLYGSDSWVTRTARRLGLAGALRPRGCPRKEKRPGERWRGGS